jgi:hypothetical protein
MSAIEARKTSPVSSNVASDLCFNSSVFEPQASVMTTGM